MGMFDVTSFVAIIQPPQSAVLAIGTVQKRPVVQGDSVVVREIMSATLSVDHRVSDGAEGAQFIVQLKEYLEHPLRLLGVGEEARAYSPLRRTLPGLAPVCEPLRTTGSPLTRTWGIPSG